MNQTKALDRIKSGSPKNRYAVAEFHSLECEACHATPKFCYVYWSGDVSMEVCPACYIKLNRIEKLMDSIPEVV